jgi:hypothetical protein
MSKADETSSSPKPTATEWTVPATKTMFCATLFELFVCNNT